MKKLLSLILSLLLLTGCAVTYDGPTQSREVLTEYYCVSYDSFGAVWNTTRSTFFYDVNGNLARKLWYRDDELTDETRTRYDENGNAVREISIDHSGLIPLRTGIDKTTYDDQGRILERIYCNGWGIETERTSYTYDDEARTQTWTDDDGQWSTTYLDDQGRVIRSVNFQGGESIYEYSTDGLRRVITSYQSGALLSTHETIYDEQGRLIGSNLYDENGQPESQVEYVYDDEANTKTQPKTNGGWRVEYYDAEGRTYLIEDYDETGELTMYQQYTYQEIQVPAETEVTP